MAEAQEWLVKGEREESEEEKNEKQKEGKGKLKIQKGEEGGEAKKDDYFKLQNHQRSLKSIKRSGICERKHT